MKTMDMERASKVEELIMKGSGTQNALVKAGYSKSLAQRYGANSKPLSDLIRKTKERYNVGFIKGFDLMGFTGEEAGQRLGKIARDGKDFDSIQAIKVINQFMSLNAQNVSNVSLGIYIVPQNSQNEENWNQKVKDFKNKAINASTVPTNENTKKVKE